MVNTPKLYTKRGGLSSKDPLYLEMFLKGIVLGSRTNKFSKGAGSSLLTRIVSLESLLQRSEGSESEEM